MKIHLVTGFLGSGKTTAIHNAALKLLQQKINVGVITNDQGIKLVDTNFFKNSNIPNEQVINGCFCCNYNALEKSLQSLVALHHSEVVFAEAVGSCTDIIATVFKPMLQFNSHAVITVSTFADVRLLQMILNNQPNNFDETINYIYLKQLEEANIIVVNKVDLITKPQLQIIKEKMQQQYGKKILLYQNSLDGDSIQFWLNTLNNSSNAGTQKSLEIDYNTYAEGEAMLAWLDAELQITSADNNALKTTEDFINKMYQKINLQQLSIGHLKFLVNQQQKISFTSNTQPLISLKNTSTSTAHLLINIRVQAAPLQLKTILLKTMQEIKASNNCNMLTLSLDCFKPGYPTPVHRM